MFWAYFFTSSDLISPPKIFLELEKQLKNGTYKHGDYTKFKIYEPKERIIMSSEYRDRVVHRWYVEKFIKPYFVPQFISTSYAGIEGRGMSKHLRCIIT